MRRDLLGSLHTNMGIFDINNPKVVIDGDSAVFASKKFMKDTDGRLRYRCFEKIKNGV